LVASQWRPEVTQLLRESMI